MSFFVHHWLQGVCLLLITVGLWIAFRNRGKPENNYKLGLAFMMLSSAIGSVRSVTTDVPIDSWSTSDWLGSVNLVVSLSFTAFLLGIAYEMRRQKKSGATEDQRVGTGFSPR